MMLKQWLKKRKHRKYLTAMKTVAERMDAKFAKLVQQQEDCFWMEDIEYQKKYRETKPRSPELGGITISCDVDGKPEKPFSRPMST